MRRILSLIITIALLLTLLSSCAQPQQPSTAAELLNLGDKYLLELDYEQALVQFLAVIEIEPMNPRGYTGAAQAYVGLGRVEEAVAVLEQGLEVIDDGSIKAMLIELGTINSEPATDGNDVKDELYYNSLSDGQKQVLSHLESALLAIDHQTAYGIQRDSEFHAICDAAPDASPDYAGFMYYPAANLTIHVYRIPQDGYSYNMAIFSGTDGNGEYFLGKHEEDEYTLHYAYYSGGKANGPFFYYRLAPKDGEIVLHTAQGNLSNGEAYGPVYYEESGQKWEQQDYPPRWYNWWPDWPER